MKFLVVGDGPEELAWARALADHSEHELWATCPSLKEFPEVTSAADLDGALATQELEAVIVGGDAGLRGEVLRRTAGAGFPCICLHPPGANADPYYQIALSRHETGAVVVPDLPGRLHPAIELLARALTSNEIGDFRVLRYDVPAHPGESDLAGQVFPKAVDVVRMLLGEIEAVTATGDPPGDRPDQSLVVQLRGKESRRAEIRVEAESHEPARLVLTAADGTLTVEHDSAFLGSSRMVRRGSRGDETTREIPPWDPKHAILETLVAHVTGADQHPDLLDGTRAMELAEAVPRSLRRGRTVDLFYEEMSESGNFKSVMTGLGCGLLVVILLLVPAVMAAKALGLDWATYILWIVPPALVVFLVLQLLRLGLKTPAQRARAQAVKDAKASTGVE
jgi:myo-inositol 2-dehydrogenase/D-chiro-inositol 1-dehydrogenase